jgi:hypothetical protein
MELFDLIKTIFKNHKDWDSVSRNDKSRNFFMTNRIMAIQFPLHAHLFNHVKISPDLVLDWWHSFLGNKSKSSSPAPKWIFTSTTKREQKKIEKTKSFEEIELFVCKKFEVSSRELRELKSFFPVEYEKWMGSLAEQIGSQKKED